MADVFISTIVERLKDVRGIEAVVLGGSHGRGTHRSDSDYDIGIYYGTPDAFDIAALNRIATELDDEHQRLHIIHLRGRSRNVSTVVGR